MISQTFAKLYQKLNLAQKQAVDTVEGTVMVIAGPGTGKTQILTLRIANILESTQMNPENILALTFTESAVYEMRSRLIDIIGRPAYSVEINTFHGFCNKIIQRYSEEFDHLLSAENITDLEQIQIIEDILASNTFEYLTPIYDKGLYIKPIQAAIGDLKKEGITPDMFETALVKEQQTFDQIPDLLNDKGAYKGKMKGKYVAIQKSISKCKELAIVFKLYQKALLEKRLYDYNDMLLEVVKVLQKKPELLQQLQEQYQYILVDEHQDTNKAQNTIVELIASYFENPNLFVVGDQKQAIFRFQGASIENFLYFKKLYPYATLILLQENYRSSQTILDAADSLIRNNKLTSEDVPKEHLIAKAGHPASKIIVAEFNDYFAEFYFIAEDIRQKFDNGTPGNEIAIIARNNRDLIPLTAFLDHLKITFSVDNDQNILQDREIEKLFLILRTIQHYGEDEWLVRAMHLNFFHIHPLDIYTLLRFCHTNKQSLYDCIAQKTYIENVTLINEETLLACFESFSQWKTLAENTTFDDVFVEILNSSGYLKAILQQPRSMEHLDRVTTLFQDIRLQIFRNHRFNLNDFLTYIDLLNTHRLSLRSKNKTAPANAVRLMTAHKSKGLEYDYVYILHVYDTHWGNPGRKRNLFKIPWHQLELTSFGEEEVDLNEDERRLFYVALTRARKAVILSYATHSLEGKEQYPSQFIGEIDSEYKQNASLGTFEDQFLQHKEIILQKTLPAHRGKDNIYVTNKEYFSELFKRQGLSVSGLNNYLECPWKYFFRNLLRLPETKNNSQLYGTAIHEALNRFILVYNKSQGTLNTLLSAFNYAVDKQPFTDKDREIFREKGLKSLEGYYQQVITNWQNDRMSELDIKGVEFDDNIFLTGKIDMLEKTGKKNDVIVYDFKTGKPKSSNVIEGKTASKKEHGNYKRQLVFYKLLLDSYLNKRYIMTTGVIEFVEPTDSGSYKSEAFDITPEEIKELSETIKNMAQDVMTLGFWNRSCDDAICEYCLLRSFVTGS